MPLAGNNTTDPRDWCWAFVILPYIEQQNIYTNVINGTNNFTVLPPPQASCAAVPIKTFLDPGRSHVPFTTTGGNSPGVNTPHTDSAINNVSFQNKSTFQGTLTITMATMTGANGTSNTVLVGEKSIDPNFATTNKSSSGWDEGIYSGGFGGTGRGSNAIYQDHVGAGNANDWGSPYPGASPFVMGDGSVRVLKYSLSGSAVFQDSLNYLNTKPFSLD
jgi:hypothetical protein